MTIPPGGPTHRMLEPSLTFDPPPKIDPKTGRCAEPRVHGFHTWVDSVEDVGMSCEGRDTPELQERDGFTHVSRRSVEEWSWVETLCGRVFEPETFSPDLADHPPCPQCFRLLLAEHGQVIEILMMAGELLVRQLA